MLTLQGPTAPAVHLLDSPSGQRSVGSPSLYPMSMTAGWVYSVYGPVCYDSVSVVLIYNVYIHQVGKHME